jgi:cell volume regulation protein A
MDPVTQMTLIITALLVVGALGEIFFARTGIPDVIWLVAAGILAGPVFNVISPEMLQPILPFFGAFALVVILTGGGLQLNLANVMGAAPRALGLAFIGYALAVIGFTLFLYLLQLAGIIKERAFIVFLMAATILGGTSSIVIIPTMTLGKVKAKIADLLNVESCVTDALSVVFAAIMIELVIGGAGASGNVFLALLQAIVAGIGLGLLGGLLYLPVASVLYGRPHAYPVLIAALLLIYSVIDMVGGNGALGLLACAIVLGNSRRILAKFSSRFADWKDPIDKDALAFHGQITFLVKSFFFFLVGLMFSTSPKIIILGFISAVVLWLLRIPAAHLALARSDFSKSEKSLVIAALPRGLAAGVLATMPLHKGVPDVDALGPLVFVIIVFTILIFVAGFAWANRAAYRSENM